MFFGHVDPTMQMMAKELAAGRPAANVMRHLRARDAKRADVRARNAGRNEPCPCGSGRKFKRCCGAAR